MPTLQEDFDSGDPARVARVRAVADEIIAQIDAEGWGPLNGPVCWTGKWTSIPSFRDILSCTHKTCYQMTREF